MLEVPKDIQFFPVETHKDHRGDLNVLFSQLWPIAFNFTQVNFSNSLKNSFRGFQVHSVNTDLVCVLKGTLVMGLKDIRKSSPKFNHESLHELTITEPQICLIPPGIAHGFYFPEDTLHLQCLTHPWNSEEKLGFRWDSPGLNIDWPMTNPILSEKDATAGSVSDLLEKLEKDNIHYD